MEEKIIVQSKQYNLKKAAIIISCAILAISILLSGFIYSLFYNSIAKYAKLEYEENYLTKYNKYVKEYDEIIEDFETKDKQYIFCDHAKKELKKSKYSSYYSTLPMTKAEFLEYHPDADSYIRCEYESFDIYDFKTYKKIAVKNGMLLYKKIISAIPLLLNFYIPVIFLLYLWLGSYSLTVTDKRVYGKVAWGKKVDMPVDSITVTSKLKLFNGISISTQSKKIRFLLVKNSNEVYSEINKFLIEKKQNKIDSTPTPATPTPITPDTTTNTTSSTNDDADQIEKYKKLLDSGAITQEEFDAKKKQLLGL